MVLPNGTQQGDNLEPTNNENLTSLENIKDVTTETSPDKVEIPADALVSFNIMSDTETDPPKKGSNAPRPMSTKEAMAIKAGNSKTDVKADNNTPDPATVQVGGLFANMSSANVPNSSVVSPMNNDIDFDKYKQYLSKNSFYFDNDSNLDQARAENQGNIAQLRNAIGSTVVNIIPEAIKQVANALDFEDYANTDLEVGNAVADLMTEWQASVNDFMPIYRENPNESLDVGDFAYWASTGRDLVTTIGGFALAGYVTRGLASGAIVTLGITGRVVTALTGSKRLQGFVGSLEAAGVGSKAKTLLTATMLNHAEGVGIGAEVFKTVHDQQYWKAIGDGKSDEEAKDIANTKAAEAASGAIKFNRINIALNLTSANLFVKGGSATAGLIKKGGLRGLVGEGIQEGVEEYVNDLSQIYGEGLSNGKPLTFKDAISRLGTKEGLESPILGFIGGAGQTALTKAGKYIQKDNNEAYVRHFNEYLMENPITASNKEETIQKATAYAQKQAGTANYKTSAREQINSLYTEQQSNLNEYKKATLADNMNDVVNATLSAQFSVDLMNQINSSDTLSQEEKDNLLERSLLSHQAYKALNTGTLNQLENVYKAYAEMDEVTAKERGILTDETPESPNYYKNKAKRALTTLNVYKVNYGQSLGFINSTEVYDSLNNDYFNRRDLKEKADANNENIDKLITNSIEKYEAEGSEESLKKVAQIVGGERDIKNVHPDLMKGKLYEDARDLYKAALVAKEKKELLEEHIDVITSSTYQKELEDNIMLYRRQKIEAEKEVKTTSKLADRVKNLFKKQAEVKKKKANDGVNGTVKPNKPNKPNTTASSTTGKPQQTSSPTPIVTPAPITPSAPPSTNPSVTFTGNIDVSASMTSVPWLNSFIEAIADKMNAVINSGKSNQDKIDILRARREELLDNDINNLGSMSAEVTPTLKELASKITSVIESLTTPVSNLSPEEIANNEAYDNIITDFALDVEDAVNDANENSKTDEEKERSLKSVIDNKYEIYSAILDTMKQRGINTTNFVDVMNEFKNVLGTRLVKDQFNTLKGLFNFTNNTSASETYDDLFKSELETNKDNDTIDKIAKVFLPSEKFVYDFDKESRMKFQGTHQTVLANNPELATDAYGNPIYNNTGSNLVAYLSQKYIKVAKLRSTDEGREYTFMDKTTIDSVINENLDPRVLQNDFIKVGDKVSFIPLESFVNDEGVLVEASGLPVGVKPIGLVINGELIKGLYLHTTDWINAENIDNTPANIESDRARLLALRERIMNGEIVETVIDNVSPGAPISNPNGTMTTFASEFAEFPVGIARSGLIETAEGDIEIPSYLSFDDGDVVSIVNGYFYYGSRTNIYAGMRASIIASLKAYISGQHNTGTNILKDQFRTDVLNAQALRNYLRKFVNLSTISINNKTAKDLTTFTEALNALPETQVYLNIINDKIYFGRGQGIDVYEIDPSIYKGQDVAIDSILAKLDSMLIGSYANVALNAVKENTTLPIIHEKGLEKVFDTYADYVKQVSWSPYGSITLPNGEKITTIQKRIHYDLDSLDGHESNVPKITKSKAVNPRKPRTKKIINNVGEQKVITFEEFDRTADIDPNTSFEGTEDLSPDVVDYSPNIQSENEVQYNLKAVNILNSDKAIQVFEKGNKNGWSLDKILTELQIPKEQKQLILDKGFRVLTNNDARILKKPDVILPIGTSGSGKSTFIKSLPQKNLVVIEPDAMRVEFTGDMNNKSKDKEIYEEAANRAIDAVKQGKQVVFDTTNLTKDKRLPFIEAIKKAIPTANIQYKLMELNPELAKQRIKADIAAGKNRANVPDATIDRHAESYKQMLDDIKNEPISNIEEEPNDNLREEIITSLLADNSFVVEVNVTKGGRLERKETYNPETDEFYMEPDEYENVGEGNTQHYSNLTVPGGTNYTENEIATPAITPSIKGHAQFSTDNGIGWFRSDEQGYQFADANPANSNSGGLYSYGKTRRILEVQSDLFQKGRDKSNLTNKEASPEDWIIEEDFGFFNVVDGKTGQPINSFNNKEKAQEFLNQYKGDNKNQFLQLLNKDNNWVTFFVKSIIQDSAKKGYEKVLFPTGNTASKVEGHTTLEEFKKQKEDRIKELEKQKENGTKIVERYLTNEAGEPYSSIDVKIDEEINQLKQELERVETEGFGALRPIYNFYENTVTNILNKTYGKNNVNLITDEYGNTWNEVTIENVSVSVDLSPDTDNIKLDAPSRIEGLSTEVQDIVVTDIVNAYYALLKEYKANNLPAERIKVFINSKIELFDKVLANAKIAQDNPNNPFNGYDKLLTQVNAIKNNRTKLEELVKRDLTREMGIIYSEDNTIIPTNTNDEQGDNLENETYADEISQRSPIYDMNEFAIDPKLSITNEIKALLKNIVDATSKLVPIQETVIENGVEVIKTLQQTKIIDRKIALQLPVYVNPDVVHGDLIRLFTKSSTNTGLMVLNFVAKEDSKLHPKIQYAISILEKNYNTKPYFINVVKQLQELNEQTQIQFLKTYNNNFTEHIFSLVKLDKSGESYDLRVLKNASQDSKKLIIQKWQNGLKNSDSYTTAIDDTNTGLYLSSTLVERFNTVFNKIKGNTDYHTYPYFQVLFAMLGINLTEQAFVGLRDGAYVNGRVKSIEQQFEHRKDGWFHLIHKQVNYIHSNKIDVSLLFEDSVFKEFADFMSKYDTTEFNTSHKNANGDTIYGVTNNRYFMERFVGLKNNQTLLKNLNNNEFSKSSYWLSQLFNKNNGNVNNGSFAEVFEYNTADGLKVDNNNTSKTVDKLGRKELIQLGLSFFFNNGMTTMDGQLFVHKFIIPALSDKSNIFTVQAPGKVYNLVNGRLATDHAQFLRSQLVEPEVLRILHHQEKGNKGIRGYDEGAGKFLMLPQLNNIPELWTNGKLNSDALIEHSDLIDEVILNYINNEVAVLYTDWAKLGLVKKGEAGVYSDKMVYADKNYLAAVEKSGTNTMEQAYSVVFNYTINYMVANANMQMLIFNDPAFFYKGNSKADGVELSGSFITNTWDNITKRYAAINGGKDDFQFPAGSTFSALVLKDAEVVSTQIEYLKKVWKGHPDYQSIIEGKNSYSKLNSGDAQEWTSLEEHLNRMHYIGYIDEVTKNRVLKNYKKTGSVNKEDLGKVLIPFKPLYFNTYKDTSGVMRTLYIKSSSLPLIKELTEGTDLDIVREYLDNPKNKVSVVTFESAVKAGANTDVLTLFDTNGNIIPDALKGSNVESSIIRNIPREGHGNQQANPDKSLKNYINDGTQQAKLIFTNLLDVAGFKNPFSTSENDKEVTGRQLADIYLEKYDERFKYFHDKFVKKFDIRNGIVYNMSALKKELIKEGLTRNWTFNEIESFDLNSVNSDFDIPLWMSISSPKIESLLSSLIDNNIRKRKRTGRAYILAANTGVRTFNSNVDTIKNGITFLDSFKGELNNSYNDKGEMTDAEILVPFRFFDNAGNLLKITDFITAGKIDHTRLPLEVLQGFGYRIPTSGVNLMANIKIVGFLPESYSDAIIAPADFTAQMGSDFDVDKFYSSLYATIYDSETKTIEKLTQKHLDIQQSKYEIIRKAKNRLRNLKNYKGSTKDAQILFNNDLIADAEKNPLIANSKPGKGNLVDLKALVLDNELTDIQRAVLNNPAQVVQRARTKPLSFGRLPEMVEKLASKLNKPYRTILNRSYQDEAYLNGKAGKVAVGNFSLDMILNSVGQYINYPVYFQHQIFTDAGVETKKSFTTLFGMKSNNINNPLLNDNSGRYKSDVLEGLMAAALDNGKEQILGKLNITDNTFDYIRAMVAMGFNEEVIMLILNQPLLKIYLDPNTDINFKYKLETTVSKLNKRFNIFNEVDEKDLYDSLDATINAKTITKTLDTVIKDGFVNDVMMTNQLGAIHTFMIMSQRGQQLNMVRSSLNGDSAGVGKNIIYSNGKMEQIGIARRLDTIKNVEGYYNKYSYKIDEDTLERELIIKPNSHGYMAAEYATSLNNRLWSKYFPFSNDIMSGIITSIAAGTGKEIFRLGSYSDYATIVLKDFKSFLNAKALPDTLPNFLRNKSTSEILKEIVYSNEKHQSLGEFILDLKEGINGKAKFSNILLDSLTINRPSSTEGNTVTASIIDIKYVPTKKLSQNENGMVNSLIDMINSDSNKEIGLWNGNLLTTRDLANLLITYQLLSKGVPSSTKFIQYIPTKYLKLMGYYDTLSNTYQEFIENVVSEETEVNPSIPFRVQHIQHNMSDYYNRATEKAYEGYLKDGMLYVKDILIPPSYVIFKVDNGYIGFARIGENGEYVKITPLGWGDNTEYNHEITNPLSINPKNNVNSKGRIEIVAKTTYKGIDNDSTLMNVIIDSEIGKKENLVVDGKTINAYPLTLLQNGYKDAYYLIKNGNSYNTIYHPLTGLSFTVGDMKVSATKEVRDNLLNKALQGMQPEMAIALGLTDSVETINIEAIEADLPNFLRVDRDKTNDVFPDDINDEQISFVEELGLSDNSMSLEDKYNLVFGSITALTQKTNPILGYFLSHAREILPVINNIPIVLNSNLRAKGKFVSDRNNNGYISINPTKFNSAEDMAATIAEEAIHALFKRQVRVNNKIVKDIEALRREVEAKLAEIHGQEAIDNMRQKLIDGTALIKGVESELLYSIYNVDEFIAAVLTKPEFQTFLNSNEIHIAKKSMWTKIIELMSGILRAFGVNVDSKLEDALAHIIALTKDIKDNHLISTPDSKYDRSIDYINEKYNLTRPNSTELLSKGNADAIAKHISNTFANVQAVVVDENYVEVMPLKWTTGEDIKTDLNPDNWDLSYIDVSAVPNEVRANYYTYALSLRARIREGEKSLRLAKVKEDAIKIEELTALLEKDRIALSTLPKLQTLADFQLRAKQELEIVDNILNRPMSSEDIIYVRNSLNFWTDVINYTLSEKHKESKQIMSDFNVIQNLANSYVTKLERIEKTFLENFVKTMTGRDLTLTDIFSDYKDIGMVTAYSRDISMYDNALLDSIWKSVQYANMKAEKEADTLMEKLNKLLEAVLPKLERIDSKNPYEVFRQRTKKGNNTRHLISPFSDTFYNDRSTVYNNAKDSKTSVAANAYATWVKNNTRVFDLNTYFPIGEELTPEIEANREALRTEIGDVAFNLWITGQSRKLESYEKRKDGYLALLKNEFKLETVEEILLNPEAAKRFATWTKKHSPYEFSKILNVEGYKYYNGIDGLDGFQNYEVIPKKAEHFNKEFDVIAQDPDLLEFYKEFNSIYDELKKYVPSSQFATLIFGGLPVIEKSIYKEFSTRGLKVGFQAVRNAMINSLTTNVKQNVVEELDLVTKQNNKSMYVSGLTSHSDFIKDYVAQKRLEYEVNNQVTPTKEIIDMFYEEATHQASLKDDFDLGKMMKIFGTLVITHKHIAAIEDTIKIGQYTINSYAETETMPDGSKAVRKGGVVAPKTSANSFKNLKESLNYFMDSQIYGNVKDEEGKTSKKLKNADEKERKAQYTELLATLEEQLNNGEITQEYYDNGVMVINRNINELGSEFVWSKLVDNWLAYVQLKLMGWNILGGFSNSGFGYISNMIEAAGEEQFNIKEMRAAYRLASSSILKNLSFDLVTLGQSAKIRAGMHVMNVLKDSSHELYSSNSASNFKGWFKWLSPYNMNQRTEYMNQAPLMIVLAKKTMVNTANGQVSLWEGMDENWEWDSETHGELSEQVLFDFRLNLNQTIKRLHGNYDPKSPIMAKKKLVGRAFFQFRTWFIESVATRFEKERYDEALKRSTKGRYNSLWTVFTKKSEGLSTLDKSFEMGKAMVNAMSFGTLNIKSFQNTKLSDLDAANMKKVAMELVLLLDIYLLIALLKAGLDDEDDENAKRIYNAALNQGTRLRSDLILYLNPTEFKNIIKDPIASLSLMGDIGNFIYALWDIENDTISSGVHKGDSRGISTGMKVIPFTSKVYSTYNSMSQIYDKDLMDKEDK